MSQTADSIAAGGPDIDITGFTTYTVPKSQQ